MVPLLIGLMGSIACAQPQDQRDAPSGLPPALTLSQAEELLVQKNFPVAQGRVQVEIAEAARRIAGLRPNPTLQVAGEQIPLHSNIPGSVPRFVSTSSDAGANPTYTVQFSRIIERGGKRELRTEQAGAVVDVTRAQVLDTIRQQLLILRQAFVAALLAKANLELARETDRQYAETEGLTEIRLRSGDIALIDVERIKAARLAFRQAVLDAQVAYSQAARDVQTILGTATAATRNPAAIEPTFAIEGALTVRPVTYTLDELKAMAIAERPDVRAAQRAVAAAESGVRLAQALRKRDVSLTMEYQRVGNDSAVGTIMSFPLFLFNNQKDVIAQAVSLARLTDLQARQTTLQVSADVEKAFLAVNGARQTLDLYTKDAVDRAVRIREIVQYSYQRGEASLLELLDAQRSTNQILTGYNQAKATYEVSYWQLVNSVGRAF